LPLPAVTGAELPCPDCGASDLLAQAPAPVLPAAPGRLKITGVKAIGVTWDAASDRPYVFVKIETDAAHD
jgi:hypothetical protein